MKKIFFLSILLLYQIGHSQQIIEAQYWFGDNFAGRVPTLVTTNFYNEIIFDIAFPDNGTNELDDFFHCRFRDNAGNWSAIYTQNLVTENTVVNNEIKVQYWFDDNFNPTNTLQLLTTAANGNLENSIPIIWENNAQKIHYRFKSAYNQWTSIQTNSLNNINLENNQIVKVEYWFGNDFSSPPASQTVTTNANNEINLELNYPISDTSQTDIMVNYRFQDAIGNWSVIQSTNIDEIENRNNKIVELEWWLNDDFANRTPMPVEQTGEAFLDIRDLTLIPDIQNTIHVRYKDKMNRWSSIFSFFPTEPGITVLVHGFQAFGELTDSTEDFKKMGAEIIERAGGGVMFVNNPDNGQIEFVDNNNPDWGYTLNNKKEIVLVYDWRDLSNNLVVNIDFGSNGYLESAADNLLASIINIPSALWGEAASLTREQILAKPKHFIAHSRGNILTLQFLHRLATYFPQVKVDQFTLLDPHPATSFGDLNTENPISPPNLPCVNGIGTNCGLTGCLDGNSVFLRIPSNVQSADNYYRTDEYYEGASDFGAFDGVRIPGIGNFNRELNNTVLGVGAPGIGGTHSAVHLWYRGTINRNENVAYPTTHQFGAETIIDITAEENTTNWYLPNLTSTIINNDFMQYENRFTTGFNRSRIGGGEPIPEIPNSDKESLTDMNRSIALRYGLTLSEYPNGVALHTVFGGYFDNENDAGWNKNGGFSIDVDIDNGKAEIAAELFPTINPRVSKLRHSLMYFPQNYNFLKINVYEAATLLSINQPSLKVTFFNHENVPIGLPVSIELYQSDSEQYIPLPNNLVGNVGTFQIEYDTNTQGSFKVDEIKLTEFGPNGYCNDTTIWASTAENPNGEWTNGKPVYGSNVIISHNYTTTNDNVSDDDNIDEPNKTLEGCVLTVNNSANVIIGSGFNLKLNGAIKVNSGTFTLNNNASLIQNSTEFPNVGNIVVKRNSNELMRLDYTMWSSPVEAQNLLTFSPNTVTNRFYTYNPNTNIYEVINPSSSNFADANGYLIRMPNNHPTVPTIWNGEFEGVPHNGRFDLDVTDGTYNAIGNPYPSPINADLFIEENNLTEAIYFWRKTNNSLNPSYATYTYMGGTSTKANSLGGSDIVPNGIIQTGQGFIAKATSNRLTFKNSMRVADSLNQFFRLAEQKSRIWLNLTNNDGFFCQTMIAYSSNATNEFDPAIDGHFLQEEPTRISSLINEEEYVIQGRAPFEISDIVPLGFKSATEGNYTIAIDNVDGLFSDGQMIYLKDNLLNTEHNLSNESYSFNTDSGLFNSRFEIVYQPTLSTQNPTILNNIIIYKENEDIVINSSSIDIKNVNVYDLSGRLLLEKKNVNEKSIRFTLETANQVLIVKVLTQDELITTKKIIN